MIKPIFPLCTVIVIFLALVGCDPGPSDEEVVASVEAQMAIAQKQTAEALPTATSAPTSVEVENVFSISSEEDGWQNYLNREYGFSVSLPPKWNHLDLSADDFDEALSAANDANPDLGPLFSSDYLNGLVATGIKFMAVDTSPDSLGSGIPTSVNVLVLDLPMDIAFDDWVELNVMQLNDLFGEDLVLVQETQFLGGIEAEKLEYESTMNDVLGRAHNVNYRQYLMLDGRKQYVLTFSSADDQFSQNEENFSRISQSFELAK